MQLKPVLHAAALAAAMLFAATASAQQPSTNPNQAGPNPGGTASPEMKAKAEHLKESIRHGTHELHQKVDAEMSKSRKPRANNEDMSEHEKGASSSRSSRSRGNESMNASSNGMGSASFRRAMSQCTDNENMQARADCAREAVEAHGG